MNSDQIGAFVRILLTTLATSLAAHGWQGAASIFNNQTVTGAIIVVATAVWAHWSNRSTPPGPPAAPSTGQGSAVVKVVLLFLLPSAFCLLTSGCALLQPGADPLIVRTEQSESIGYSLFETVQTVDNSNRSFWQTNAPGYHAFCDWLRQPVVLDQTNLFPRGLAMLHSLDTVKLDYKQGYATTNALITALSTVDAAIVQAQQYLAVINAPKVVKSP